MQNINYVEKADERLSEMDKKIRSFITDYFVENNNTKSACKWLIDNKKYIETKKINCIDQEEFEEYINLGGTPDILCYLTYLHNRSEASLGNFMFDLLKIMDSILADCSFEYLDLNVENVEEFSPNAFDEIVEATLVKTNNSI